jgi:hypothetical protein
MKTHVIRLEAYDDVTSIRDKIAWSRATRILLAFPKRRAPRLNAVDLNLILRQAVQLGGQLAMVTRAPELAGHARSLGIPVFDSIAEAQRRPWTLMRRRRPLTPPAGRETDLAVKMAAVRPIRGSPAPMWLRAAAFILGLAGFFALALFFVPSATIQITPRRTEQVITMQFWANPGVPAAMASGGMPARLETIEVEGSLEGAGSLKTTIADQTAQGKLILTNLSESPVEVPEVTLFQTTGEPPIRFLSRQAATVPGGIGETVEVPIQAMLAGEAGNVPENTIQAVEGRLGLFISANNPEPMSGGSDREARAGSEQDYEMLYDALYTSLAENALRQLEARAGESVVIVGNSLKLERILQHQRTPAAGEPADRIRLDLRLEFSALSIAVKDIERTALLALNASLPSDYRPLGSDVAIFNINDPYLDAGGTVRWESRVSRTVAAAWNPQEILPGLAGLTVPQAAAMLVEQYDLLAEPEITVTPAWWSRLPFVAFRIQMVEK